MASLPAQRSSQEVSMQSDSANLDVLRSSAVLFVVLSHLPATAALVGNHAFHTQSLGTFGVVIFFVHTCLVLMLSLERDARRAGAFPATIPFLLRRAFRIYPLSVLAVLTVSGIAWAQSGAMPNWWAVISNLLLIQNITGHQSTPLVLWSLPYEFQMYLFLPALYMLVRRAGCSSITWLLALWLAAIGVVAVFWRMGWSYELVRYIPCFLPGVMAFSLWQSPRRFSPWVLLLYIGVVSVFYPWVVAHGVKVTMVAWPVCLGLGLLIPRCREIQLGLLRRAGKLVAKYSYGIYLIHSPLIGFAFHTLDRQPVLVQWSVFVSGLVSLSYLAFHLIENPGIQIGRTLAKRLSRERRFSKRGIALARNMRP
jgi:peptidoglycan/LPS O-acetylase OafA/YrhL